MAKKIVRLNESELKDIIKEVILEMAPAGLSEFSSDDDDYDPFAKYGIGDINDITKGNEYHGETDKDAFNQEDPDDVEAKIDADVNNSADRNIDPDDEPETWDDTSITDEPEGTITPLSTPTEEPEEQHQEGDVIYTDYYIRKYSYQIILTYEIIVDDHTEQYESVSPFITHEPDTETDTYTFSDIDDTVISNKKVYIKDVTGIRRTTKIR